MARFNIAEHQQGNTVILELDGDLVFDEATDILRQNVRRLISEGKKNISLNLEKVPYVDSGGIGEFISTLIAVDREGGELKLINPTHKICTLLEMSNLMTIFKIENEPKNAAHQ